MLNMLEFFELSTLFASSTLSEYDSVIMAGTATTGTISNSTLRGTKLSDYREDVWVHDIVKNNKSDWQLYHWTGK